MTTTRTGDGRYHNAYGYGKASPVFSFVKDMSLNGGSGAWRPLEPSDFANVSISGATVTVDLSSLEAINNDILSNASGQTNLLVYVSGQQQQIEQNTKYQDTPFQNQLSISDSAIQFANFANKKGWATISIDPDTSDAIWIGGASVTSGNGFKLSTRLPATTISSDNLSEWYCIGTASGEKAFVVGAYVN